MFAQIKRRLYAPAGQAVRALLASKKAESDLSAFKGMGRYFI